jgi:hypothetical protein
MAIVRDDAPTGEPLPQDPEWWADWSRQVNGPHAACELGAPCEECRERLRRAGCDLSGNEQPTPHHDVRCVDGIFVPIGQPVQPTKVPRVLTLADIQRKPTDWIWDRRIARGTITLLDGDPGLGKSFLTLAVASRVTRGYQMPPDVGLSGVSPGSVLLMSAEDDPARTIRPRLDELGADLARVHLLAEVQDGATVRPPVLPDDLDDIETLVVERSITLVVIDPVMAFLGGKVDSHKDSDVRKVLHGIKTMAERTQAAVVIVRHLNKLVGVDSAIYRGGGSIGIIGAARSALLVGKHPDNPEARVLCRSKGNLSLAPSALAYKIRSTDHGATVEWLGEVDLSADDLLRRRPTDEAKQAEKAKSDAVQLLDALDRLDPDKHGVTVRKVRDMAGIGKPKMDRAMATLLTDAIIESIDLEVPVGANGGTRSCEGIRRTTPAPQAHIGTNSTRHTNLFEPT